MTPAAPAGSRVLRTVVLAAGAALIAAIAYQAVGAAVFLPHFASEDPREVVMAYFEAQRWGFESLSERALAPAERELRHRPMYVDPLIEDTLFATELVVSQPADIELHGEYDEETQFVVTYRSGWRNSIGEAPGMRHWFVYAGRNEGDHWSVLSQGTGP